MIAHIACRRASEHRVPDGAVVYNGRDSMSGVVDAQPLSVRPAAEDRMKISIRDAGEAKIVEVEGRVDMSTSADLRKSLFAILLEAPKLVLNLGAIRYIDSSGIAILIEALKDSQRLNKEFVLFGLSPAVEQVFRLTHVMRIFRVFNTEQEALGNV